MYNRIVVSPGENLYLGTEGGVLLLAPPSQAPGEMSLTDMQNRTWHLLREDGPDTGFPAPTQGDFNVTVVTRDLNIALGQFISDSGLPPGISERQDTLPVFALQDMPLPPGMISLTQIEYNPYNGFSYFLPSLSLTEFVTMTGGLIDNSAGQPRCYREPFAGQIRLYPQPSQGNAVGPGTGTLTIGGSPVAGQSVTATIVSPGFPTVTTAPYVTIGTDDTSSIAYNLAAAINTSSAVSGASAFLQPTSSAENVITISALTAPGTAITIQGAITGTGATISPTTATPLAPTGDTMTWYYTSMGRFLINPGDTPGIPPQFHMAPVYRVLMDYWRRKQDLMQAKEYERMYGVDVGRAKAFTFDANRASQPTISGDEFASTIWPVGGA